MTAYAYTQDLPVEAYQHLRSAVHWPELPLEEAASGLEHSAYTVACRFGSEVIGCARIVWDHGYIAYFSDLIVLPEQQKKGVGKTLTRLAINWIKEQLKPGWKIKIVLISTHGNESFYRKLGFTERPAGSMGAGLDMWLEK